MRVFGARTSQEVTRRIDRAHKHFKAANRLAGQIATVPVDEKGGEYRRGRHRLSREIVHMSLIIRNLGLTNSERKRLADRVGKTVEIMRSLDRQISDMEKKIASTSNKVWKCLHV